jgi:hypothetical protein
MRAKRIGAAVLVMIAAMPTPAVAQTARASAPPVAASAAGAPAPGDGRVALDDFLAGYVKGCSETHPYGLFIDSTITIDKAGRWILGESLIPASIRSAFGRPTLKVVKEKAGDLATVTVPLANARFADLQAVAIEARRSTAYYLADDALVFAEPEAVVRAKLAGLVGTARKRIGAGSAKIEIKMQDGRPRLTCYATE